MNGNFTLVANGVTSPGAHICQNGSSVGSTCTSNVTDWTATCSAEGCAGTSSPGSILFNGTGGSGWNGNTGYTSYLGLYGTVQNAPTGGNAIAIDGDSSYSQKLSQTISGLVPGNTYALGFYQGAAQQKGTTGPTTEQWQVSLGSQTIESTLMSNPSQGYTPWMPQILNFTATNSSEVLSFLAQGTPAGEPPVVLLSNVSLTAVPEPVSLSILGIPLVAVVAARRRRPLPRTPMVAARADR
jgi:hypothetical protein